MNTYSSKLLKDVAKNKYLYIMALPVIAYYLLFHYGPMYGAIIAFKEYSPAKGILSSPWVGFKHFEDFFNSVYFFRVLRNTLAINFLSLLFGFPAPIIFALLLNEIRNNTFKRSVQTVTYMPHFISVMVISGMILEFTSKNGIINDLLVLFGRERSSLLMEPYMFWPVYVISGIWQEIGWGSIIYLAALAGIDVELYDAAIVDGAGKWKQMIHVTLPGILPTIIVLLILRIGNMMSLGFEKIILLYNPNIYETADVISSFTYRRGLEQFDYSYSAAVGFFNSVINFILIMLANRFSRKLNGTSLW